MCSGTHLVYVDYMIALSDACYQARLCFFYIVRICLISIFMF